MLAQEKCMMNICLFFSTWFWGIHLYKISSYKRIEKADLLLMCGITQWLSDTHNILCRLFLGGSGSRPLYPHCKIIVSGVCFGSGSQHSTCLLEPSHIFEWNLSENFMWFYELVCCSHQSRGNFTKIIIIIKKKSVHEAQPEA